ncbi:MAG: TraB/GumN family protein [Methanocalculaceae archaeon]|jgi:pheromone shutdown-related protein TraB|nr:TraB/GumN family protein [Methanocalculaceae archaeon]
MTKIHIIGTAHISQKSIDEVHEAVDTINPDVIAIELDPGRFAALKQQMMDAENAATGTTPISEKQASPEIKDILKGNLALMLVQWTLAYVQRKIGMNVGIEPGAEMKEAILLAEKRGIRIVLIDRDIKITLSRFWGGMKILEKIKLILALMQSMFAADAEDDFVGSIDKNSIDELTKPDIIEMALEEFRTFSPNGTKALIDERDAYLAHGIIDLEHSPYERAVVVVGAGHVPGITRYRETPSTLPPIAELLAKPKHYSWDKIFGGLFVAMFAIIIVAIAFSGATGLFIGAIIYWVLLHALFAGIATLLVRGHPLSATTAAALAWLTPLVPFLSVGLVVAIVEAKMRPPAAGDLKEISKADTIGEMLSVPLCHILLVAAVANIGGIAATFCFFIFLAPLLGVDLETMMQILGTGFSNLWQFLTG